MQFLEKVFKFYIYSNLHVAIAAFCLTKLTLDLYNIDEITTPLFVFFATIISYNFIRFYTLNTIKVTLSIWIMSNRWLLISLNFVSVLFLIKLSFELKSEFYIILIPFMIATFFYSVPFLFKRKNFRNLPGLKLFIITITWAGVTVLFPLNNSEIQFSNEVWLIFGQRFLFLFAITIPFDIRDIDFDKSEIKTLPKVLGIKNSKIIGVIALLIFFSIDFLRDVTTKKSIYITLFIVLISILFLIFSNKKQNPFYCSFWIESLPILWFLLMFFIA